MRLAWIGALVLLIASIAALISNGQSGQLLSQGWESCVNLLPDSKVNELQSATLSYAAGLLKLLPEPVRQKFAAKIQKPAELMTFRSLVLWHLFPAFAIPALIGFLEGSWARTNQKTLIKMHSPMRFSLAVTALALAPVLALLWIAAPLSISPTLLVFAVGTIAILGTRSMVVHAPTQF